MKEIRCLMGIATPRPCRSMPVYWYIADNSPTAKRFAVCGMYFLCLTHGSPEMEKIGLEVLTRIALEEGCDV